MTDDQFKALCNTYGFAPSRALREMLDKAMAQERERIIAQNAPEIEKINAHIKALEEANEAFGKRQEWWNERMFVLEQQRDALITALHNISLASQDSGSTREGMGLYARAAIKAVEENT